MADDDSRRALEATAHLSTIVASLVAIVALAWGAYTFIEGARLQREVVAVGLWHEHLKLSLEKPAYSVGQVDSADKKQIVEYRWFVGHALHAGEAIHNAVQQDTGWRNVLKELIDCHREYVTGDDFVPAHYDPAFLAVVDEALNDTSLHCEVSRIADSAAAAPPARP